MTRPRYVLAAVLVLCVGILIGCGSGTGSAVGTGGQSQTASVFTVATDAPVSSVVSFQLTVNSITLSNGTSEVSVLSQPAVIDFARLNGLRELVDLSSVPVGRYTS